MKTFRVEFHCHTESSKDSLVKPEDLVRVCREKGIDRVVITDHNSITGALEAQKLDPELVIVGEEIKTTRGELLCAYVQQEIPSGLAPTEAIERLKEQGAFISVSHPFDAWRAPWYSDGLDEIRDQIDAIEIFNSRALRQDINQKAQEYADLWGLAGTAGSDAHTLREIGNSTMRLPEFNNAAELRNAIKRVEYDLSRAKPRARFDSRYAVMRKVFKGSNK